MKHENGEGEMERCDVRTANARSHACTRGLHVTHRNCIRKNVRATRSVYRKCGRASCHSGSPFLRKEEQLAAVSILASIVPRSCGHAVIDAMRWLPSRGRVVTMTKGTKRPDVPRLRHDRSVCMFDRPRCDAKLATKTSQTCETGRRMH